MLAIYVRKIAALCVFALMLGAMPVSAESADPIEPLLETLKRNAPDRYDAAENGARSVVIPEAYKTTDLQRLYDKWSGTEKPLTILKNNREFLMVQPSGKLELFADDTEYCVQATGTAPVVSRDEGYRATLRTGDVVRKIVLDGNAIVEKYIIKNDSSKPVQKVVDDAFGSEFKDMFELRNWKRDKRGEVFPIRTEGNTITLSYKGLDGLTMTTTVIAAKRDDVAVRDGHVVFSKLMQPNEQVEFDVDIIPSPSPVKFVTYDEAQSAADAAYHAWRESGTQIETDSEDWNHFLARAWKDIYMLRHHMANGDDAIDAGTPLFACPFGRDDIITSIQLLQFRPDIARGVLRLLAHHQGTKDDPYRAEKPGKIMHELRVGEMARNHEIPFTPYYGTVDATPLYVVLLSRYYQQTGDIALLKELEPNLQAALAFLETESAETGYLRYGGHGKETLSNQGWKDSGDSISYSNGELAKPPIALSEVQAYLFEAYLGGARLENVLGHKDVSDRLNAKAAALKDKFNTDFWMPARDFVAIALDGDGHQVDTVSSNPGHALSVPLLKDDYAQSVARRLMAPDMFTGFGVRTLASGELRYFPNSYHNGSVWPHDTSLIAAGMTAVEPDNTAKLADALLSAASYQNDFRLPELFGGWSRDDQPVPIPYPVACEPQAWAAGTPFMLLAACSGLNVDGTTKHISITHPRLPQSLNQITFRNLAVGPTSKVSLKFVKTPSGTDVQVLENADKLDISVIK
jgi:glycogen debranching enzyme